MYWYRIVAVSPFGQRSEPGEVSLSAGKTFAPKAPRKKDNPVVDLGNNQSIFVDLNWLTPLDVLGDYEDASVESYNIYRACRNGFDILQLYRKHKRYRFHRC